MNIKQLQLTTSILATTLLASTLSAQALTLGPVPFTLGSSLGGAYPTNGGLLGVANTSLRGGSFGEQDIAPWSTASNSVTQRFSSYNFVGISGWVIDAIYVIAPSFDTVLSFWDAGLSQPFIDFTVAPGSTWTANGSVNGIILNDDRAVVFGAQTDFNSTLTGGPTFPFTVQAGHAYSLLVTRYSGNAVFSGNLFIDYHIIPEPSTYALALGAGALGFSFWMRRKNKVLA